MLTQSRDGNNSHLSVTNPPPEQGLPSLSIHSLSPELVVAPTPELPPHTWEAFSSEQCPCATNSGDSPGWFPLPFVVPA